MSTQKPSQVLELPISSVLQQITNDIRHNAPSLQITMKPWTPDTTWTSILAEVSEALKTSDKNTRIFPDPSKPRTEAFMEQLSPPGFKFEFFPSTSASEGLPIQTSVPAHIELPEPTPRTPEAHERLRKRAKEDLKLFSHLQPYVITKTATAYDQVIPLISGTLRLRGIDAEEPYTSATEIKLDRTDMMWDTGSHCCIITRDILPPGFASYLDRPENDPYRDATSAVVQVDGYVALSNTGFHFDEIIFRVVPPSMLPNSRSGVFLGQRGFIDRIVHTATPRAILQHRGEEIGEDEWGTITISQYVNMDSVLHNPE